MIEEIEKQLALTHDLMQPSKDTLHRRVPCLCYSLPYLCYFAARQVGWDVRTLQ